MIRQLYKMLWKRLGGRPWTYIIRGNPLWKAIVVVGLIGIGILSLEVARPIVLLVGVGIGTVLGHLFW